MLLALECAAVLTTIAAAAIDVRTRRIPNVLAIVLLLLGIAGQAVTGGLSGAAIALALVVAVILTGSFAHARGWIGGGDVKLVAGCIACLEPQLIPSFLAITAIAGGLLATATAARERRVSAVLGNVAYGLIHGDGRIPASASSVRLPYAVAICCGFLVTVALRFLPSMRLTL